MSEEKSETEATKNYQTNDFIALALGRLAAQRVTPETIHEFRKFITCGQVLRSVISFRAFITKQERDPLQGYGEQNITYQELMFNSAKTPIVSLRPEHISRRSPRRSERGWPKGSRTAKAASLPP